MKTYIVRVRLEIAKTCETEAENEEQAKEIAYDECRKNPGFVDVISNEAELMETEEA